MNIKDVTEIKNDGRCRLEQIWDRQRELMKKYHGIEKKNGLLLFDGCPIDLNDKMGQARIKDFCWRITEELAESAEAWGAGDVLHAQEEIADALHFMVELLILSGIEPKDILKSTVDGDRMDTWFNTAGSDAHFSLGAFDIIKYLGLAANCLKNKPWKQTHILTDVARYRGNLGTAFCQFPFLCVFVGMGREQMFELYMKKSEVNKFRQRSNY
jgi:phosphoribosyl-ATP pyrophosphohydrolase